MNQKGVIAPFLILSFLLVGIVVGVYLLTSGNPLKIFSRASNNSIVVKDSSGNSLPEEGGLPVINNTQVQIELEAPPPP